MSPIHPYLTYILPIDHSTQADFWDALPDARGISTVQHVVQLPAILLSRVACIPFPRCLKSLVKGQLASEDYFRSFAESVVPSSQHTCPFPALVTPQHITA